MPLTPASASPTIHEARLVAITGIVYVGVAIVGGLALDASVRVVVSQLMSEGSILSATIIGSAVPVAGTVPLLLVLRREHLVKRLLVPGPAASKAVVWGVLAFALFLELDHLHWWPFLWRRSPIALTEYGADLLHPSGWPALCWQILYVGVLIPVVEEYTFRFGFLRILWNMTGSRAAAIVISSIAFGLAHWGPGPIASRNSLCLTLLALVLGSVASRGNSSLRYPVAIHCARNLSGVASLLIWSS